MTMGTIPIFDFRGLRRSRAWGHGELNTPRPHPCRMEAGAGSDHDGTRNMSRAVHLLYLFRYQIKGRFCQYISLPMKYTVSGSTLQYNVGLTLSFLSLISRGVGAIQKGNTSIYTINEIYSEWQYTKVYIIIYFTHTPNLYNFPGVGAIEN